MRTREGIIGSILDNRDRIRHAETLPKEPMHESYRTPQSAVRALCASILLCGWAAAAAAQFTQYTSPGDLAKEAESQQALVEDGWERARWLSGNLRLDPRFEVRNFGYVDNVFGDFEGEQRVSDVHATVGAGLAGYWRLGTNLYAAGFASSEYNWWEELEELRTLSVNGGAGLYAFFNRLSVSAEVMSVERERPLNAELEAPVLVKTNRAEASFELELGGLAELVGAASIAEVRHADDIEPLLAGFDAELLDRDVETLRVGLGFGFGDDLQLVLGLEDLRTDFLTDLSGRSSKGTDPFLDLRYQGSRLTADLSVVARSLEFSAPRGPGPERLRRDFDGSTGLLRVGVDLGRSTNLVFYGGSNLVYSARDDSVYFSEERLGVVLERGLGSRLRLSLLGELGDTEYTDLEGDAGRTDDFDIVGGGVIYELGPSTELRLEVHESRYDSNRPEFDRTSRRISLMLSRSLGIIPF